MKLKNFPFFIPSAVFCQSGSRHAAQSRADREDTGIEYLEFIFSTVNRAISRLPGRIIRQDEFLRGHALVLDSDRLELNSFFDPRNSQDSYIIRRPKEILDKTKRYVPNYRGNKEGEAI